MDIVQWLVDLLDARSGAGMTKGIFDAAYFMFKKPRVRGVFSFIYALGSTF